MYVAGKEAMRKSIFGGIQRTLGQMVPDLPRCTNQLLFCTVFLYFALELDGIAKVQQWISIKIPMVKILIIILDLLDLPSCTLYLHKISLLSFCSQIFMIRETNGPRCTNHLVFCTKQHCCIFVFCTGHCCLLVHKYL